MTGSATRHAFLSAANGGATLTDLGVLAGGTNSFAYGINTAGTGQDTRRAISRIFVPLGELIAKPQGQP